MSKPIEQQVTFETTAARLYDILMSSKEHGAMTGAPADIKAEEGGAFACHSGQITGRTLELEPGKRIVQAWRAGSWPAGEYSVVQFSVRDEGGKAVLNLRHTGVPADAVEHIDGGWHKMYWQPLAAYLKN